MTDPRLTSATTLLETAAELEAAAAHCRIASGHFGDQDVPRACAHTLAAQGHLLAAGRRLEEVAITHARKAMT